MPKTTVLFRYSYGQAAQPKYRKRSVSLQYPARTFLQVGEAERIFYEVYWIGSVDERGLQSTRSKLGTGTSGWSLTDCAPLGRLYRSLTGYRDVSCLGKSILLLEGKSDPADFEPHLECSSNHESLCVRSR